MTIYEKIKSMPIDKMAEFLANNSFECNDCEEHIRLSDNPDIENFLIFDDENDMDNLESHLVLCDTTRGFGLNEFNYAERLHKRFINRKLIN